MKPKKTIALILLALNLGLALMAWRMLPETVITQISFTGGAARTMPKAAAVLLPVAFAAGGTALGLTADDAGARKGLLLSGAGLVILLIMLVVNL